MICPEITIGRICVVAWFLNINETTSLQEFCRESLCKDILIAEASHNLFENNMNGHIYLPMVEKYTIRK